MGSERNAVPSSSTKSECSTNQSPFFFIPLLLLNQLAPPLLQQGDGALARGPPERREDLARGRARDGGVPGGKKISPFSLSRASPFLSLLAGLCLGGRKKKKKQKNKKNPQPPLPSPPFFDSPQCRCCVQQDCFHVKQTCPSMCAARMRLCTARLRLCVASVPTAAVEALILACSCNRTSSVSVPQR